MSVDEQGRRCEMLEERVMRSFLVQLRCADNPANRRIISESFAYQWALAGEAWRELIAEVETDIAIPLGQAVRRAWRWLRGD